MTEDNLDRILEDAKNKLDDKFKKFKDERLTVQNIPNINQSLLTDRFYTQEEYINICNSSGLVLASCADYYNAAKYHGGTGIKLMPSELNKSQYSAIRQWNLLHKRVLRIFTSDAVEYSRDLSDKTKKISFDANLIRNHNSSIEKSEKVNIAIPVYNDNIRTICSTVIGLKFLQTVFNTEDTPKELYKNISNIFSEKVSEVYVSTPEIRYRHFRESIILEAEYLNNGGIRLHIYTKHHKSGLTGRAYCLEKNKARVD